MVFQERWEIAERSRRCNLVGGYSSDGEVVSILELLSSRHHARQDIYLSTVHPTTCTGSRGIGGAMDFL
jgi:hypothetical protein